MIFGISNKDFSDKTNLIKKIRNLNEIVDDSVQIRQSMTLENPQNDNTKSTLNIVNFASRYLNSPDSMQNIEIAFFQNLLYASNYAINNNPQYVNTLILIVVKLNDIPAWFYINNPNVRIITIPNPDRCIRKEYIDNKYDCFTEKMTTDIEKVYFQFIDLTEGMKLLELKELQALYERNNTPVEEIGDVVAIYKYGFKENKWAQIKGKLTTTKNMRGFIQEHIMGQDHIIDKIVQVIKRAVVGLSGLQHSSSSKPKGIIFLAGPTGTGKTEIVKTVTKLLFEDEKMLIRFDMSEYSAEHSDQKLFGAPPGYVGYDSGGQLTNAVKNNPFSVLLFDEIEKAHPKIMDKFLQILEDGRMTDGQGNTIYFTETLIFFTSNLGISQEITDPNTGLVTREILVKPSDAYDVIQEKVFKAINDKYKPEVVNRFGENILVFKYIDVESSKKIVNKQIQNISVNYLKNNKIDLKLNQTAFELLYKQCLEDKPRSNGGRGIGNVIEEQLLNPLAEYIFDENIQEGDIINVNDKNGKFDFTRSVDLRSTPNS